MKKLKKFYQNTLSLLKRLWLKTRKTPIEIYTDGSVKNGIGSWAYVVVQDNKIIHENCGRIENACSNRMEFQAVIEALVALPPATIAILYSDSRVVIDAVSNFVDWKSREWVKKNHRPIPNVDLMKEIESLSSLHQISWKWIKAHRGYTFNEYCDLLCIKTRKN